MSTFDPTKRATLKSNRRGGHAITNALLRIEGETISYLDLSERFQVSEETIRLAVRKARGLKAGLSWTTLHLVMDAEVQTGIVPR
ncbi:hypothetical protein [Paraburkholderia aspalathi]|uniref:Uncharacterized protein n=1 Tax=Paraburkholderia aspalathi TaxID=1324617 RepID=A0A1I7AC62_9BURK|nr:hypothetical protein [Paraburkholderia aspalathi]SFT72542.1 hypothetical protein SAMN05192563_1003258 [Paraburkholderia aspalathi]